MTGQIHFISMMFLLCYTCSLSLLYILNPLQKPITWTNHSVHFQGLGEIYIVLYCIYFNFSNSSTPLKHLDSFDSYGFLKLMYIIKIIFLICFIYKIFEIPHYNKAYILMTQRHKLAIWMFYEIVWIEWWLSK